MDQFGRGGNGEKWLNSGPEFEDEWELSLLRKGEVKVEVSM